jgi:hypothetical protein
MHEQFPFALRSAGRRAFVGFNLYRLSEAEGFGQGSDVHALSRLSAINEIAQTVKESHVRKRRRAMARFRTRDGASGEPALLALVRHLG